jgi:chaperonin GroEL (HSP60 family)
VNFIFKDEIKIISNRLLNLIYSISKSDRFYLQKLNELKDCLSNHNEKLIYDTIASHMLNAESISSGASDVFLHLALSKVDYSNAIATVLRSRDLEALFSNYADEMTINCMKKAVELVGFRGKITLARGTSQQTVVELTKGYVFDKFCSAFYQQNIDISKARVAIIDGYIESISEIHHLLQKVSEEKEPFVIFARGYSNDVINTLKVNFDRKTIICIPIIVKFDLENINTLNDIAVITGNDVVSSNKGELISSIDYHKLQYVDSITIMQDKICLQNKKTLDHVNMHVKFLQNKITEADNDATINAVTARISRLGSDQVVIKAPDCNDQNQRLYMLDRCIRSYKNSIEHGIITVNEKVFPLSSVKTGELYFRKFSSFIEELGCVIYNQ